MARVVNEIKEHPKYITHRKCNSIIEYMKSEISKGQVIENGKKMPCNKLKCPACLEDILWVGF